MANRLLNQDRVQAVRQNVQEMIAQNLHKTREMLLRDRALVEDDCILDWVSIVAPGIATVPLNEMVTKDDDEEETTTSFHSTHYFTKEMNNDLEAQLATGFVQQLMTKPVSVKPLEEEVKVLDAMVRSTEKQLLQLERHGAGYRSSDESKKIFASVDEVNFNMKSQTKLFYRKSSMFSTTEYGQTYELPLNWHTQRDPLLSH
ncbi:unnamed protein product [Aphanomyces euteiches]